MVFNTLAEKISFIVSKLTTQKSKLGDSNSPVFCTLKSQWNFSQKNNFIVTEISFVVGEKFHREKIVSLSLKKVVFCSFYKKVIIVEPPKVMENFQRFWDNIQNDIK